MTLAEQIRAAEERKAEEQKKKAASKKNSEDPQEQDRFNGRKYQYQITR